MSSRYGRKKPSPTEHPLTIDYVQAYAIMMWASRLGDPEAEDEESNARLLAWEKDRKVDPVWKRNMGHVEWHLERVPVSKLRIDRTLHIDKKRVEKYATQKDTGAPPILVGAGNRPLDGQHRLLAARKRGDKTILAYMPQLAE